MGGREKELQDVLMNYRMLESRLESLIRQREMLVARLGETAAVLDSLDEVKKSKDMLFSLGGDAYTVGRVTDRDSIIVGIGAGVFLGKTVEEGKATLVKRKGDFEKAAAEVQSEIMKASSLMEQVSMQIQKAHQNSS